MTEILEELHKCVKFREWPKHVFMNSITGLSDVYYAKHFWKSVDKMIILEDITQNGSSSPFYFLKTLLEEYYKEFLIVGYNPLELEASVKVSCKENVTDKLIKELENLHNKCELRVQKALICEPGKWCSLGSEKEVDEEKSFFRKDKISVEWIGTIEKKPENWNLIDENPKDLLNECVEIAPEQEVMYEFKPKKKQDTSVQVHVKKKLNGTQTDIGRIREEFLQWNSENLETRTGVDDQLQTGSEPFDVGKEILPDVYDRTIDDEHLNYFKSFVNTEHRRKLISSVAWHPTRKGFVAVAYHENLTTDSRDKLLSVENVAPVVRKRYLTMNELDVRTNKSVFDWLSCRDTADKWQDTNDTVSGLGEDEHLPENENLLKAQENCETCDLFIYNEVDGKPQRTSSTIKRKTEKSTVVSKTDNTWVAELLTLSEKQISNFDVEMEALDDETNDFVNDEESFEDNAESESSFDTRFEPFLNIPHYDDVPSDDSEEVEDYLQITDTDSSVFIWDCNNDFYPHMKLYNVHDINTIKFDSYDGDLLVGGSVSGQIILWDLHNAFEIEEDGENLTDELNILSDFMENLPEWQIYESKYPTVYPVTVSERNISHLNRITCVEWMHSSLKISTTGVCSKVSSEDHSRQILTSSTDGSIKIWDIKKTSSLSEDSNDFIKIESKWDIELVYNIVVTSSFAEKFTTPIRFFKIFQSPARYITSLENTCYVPDSKQNIKYHQLLTLANDIGEVGVIRWFGKEEDGVENCKHEWWSTCHDAAITSLSQNYYFPNIILTTGGRIFSLWDTGYKGGPIWWQQYGEHVSINHGCFTPFHPGVIYISKDDGKLDIWDIRKQVHNPVKEIKASGFSISSLSVVVPPSPQYQISIADSDGNFHILNQQYDMTWNQDDFMVIDRFFKQAVESRRQLQIWKQSSEEWCTVTDLYGFEHKPLPNKSTILAERVSRLKEDEKSSITETEESKKTETFTEKLVQTEEYKKKLREALENLKYLRNANYETLREEILSNTKNTFTVEQSVDDIIDKYCK